MEYNLTKELQEYLNPGEKLIWTDRPEQGVVFRQNDIFVIPFSLFWCILAIFGFLESLNSIEFIFMLPFVIVGLLFAFGRFIIDSYQRENVFYGITNERIIIKSGVYNKTIQSFNIKSVAELKCEETSNGRGNIYIGPQNSYGNVGGWWPGMNTQPVLELILNARNVYNKIIEIQKSN
jgi:hypothetical protein